MNKGMKWLTVMWNIKDEKDQFKLSINGKLQGEQGDVEFNLRATWQKEPSCVKA